MKTTSKVLSSLLDWCGQWRWDWMMKLLVPTHLNWEATDRLFRRWMTEIELADGTVKFRWARLIVRPDERSPTEFFVLVGGLSAKEWRWWAQRWSAMTGEEGSIGALEYANGESRLSLALKRITGDHAFDIDLRIGPQKIRHNRTLKVDGNGNPTDLTILKAPAARRKVQRMEPTHWQSVLDFDQDDRDKAETKEAAKKKAAAR